MATIDLKDAYFLISVNTRFRKFLRFVFVEFTCVHFGLCTAPWLFTKIMKPIVAYLRSQGFMSVHYLDDFLLLDHSYSRCVKNINLTCYLLSQLGFIINFQ